MNRSIQDKIRNIYHDYKWKIPKINPSLFRGDSKKIEEMIKDLEKFLNAPYIEDIFGRDEKSRSKFHRWISKDIQNYNSKDYKTITNCALRVNLFGHSWIRIYRLENLYIGNNIKEFKKIRGEIKDLIPKTEKYRKMCFQERMGHVKKIKRKTYELLKFLSQQ